MTVLYMNDLQDETLLYLKIITHYNKSMQHVFLNSSRLTIPIIEILINN
jgi:hypothetical protein